MDEPLNLVLFSGTDDKLQAAAVLTAGAAALGRPVNLFLQYWALDAFRKARIERDHGLAPEAGVEGRAAVDALRAAGQASWSDTLRQAKELGGVDITRDRCGRRARGWSRACGMAVVPRRRAVRASTAVAAGRRA